MEAENIEDQYREVSALEHNIKTKKDTSYYYAHAYKFEKKENDPAAKVITGPGIITGGDPILLESVNKSIEIVKEPKKFIKYIFYDDDKFVVIKIDLPEEMKDLICAEYIDIKFQETSLDMRVNVPNSDAYIYSIKKLFKKIIPEECKIKVVKGKLVINLCKSNEDDEWSKLSA